MDLCEILEGAGYAVAGQACDGLEAIELCRECKPDLVLMDVKMPLLNGMKATQMIKEEKLAPCVVLLTAYSGQEFIDEAKNLGVKGYLVKPVNEKGLLPTIEVALSISNEILCMEETIHKTKDELKTRIIIDKAKGILMKKYSLTEEDAYSSLRKISMDKNYSIKKVAQAIICNE